MKFLRVLVLFLILVIIIPRSFASDIRISLFDRGIEFYQNGDYENASIVFESYLKNYGEIGDINAKNARKNLGIIYEKIGDTAFEGRNWSGAIDAFEKSIIYNGESYRILFNIGGSYYRANEFIPAKKYFERARTLTTNSAEIQELDALIKKCSGRIALSHKTNNKITNDPLSSQQYYLEKLNIPKAWNSIKNPQKVIVAVIDDGVDILHPDLVGRIWKNPKEIPWDGIDNDNNGKIDDVYGWNFAENIPNITTPSSSHGTRIAGIIGANTNNQVGIAGIAKNISIMPLRVFGSGESASGADIISAMRYAVDNGANIINLSLGAETWEYSEEYDNMITYAYQHGVSVVIAGGNGDTKSDEKTGIDTSISPLSPVCNSSKNTKSIIGVGAYDQEGYKADFSNYGKCINFYTYGTDIVSPTLPDRDNNLERYSPADGTSFSAPIVTGIIGLGYNVYGYANPDIVYDSLSESRSLNTVGNKDFDAVKYIQTLGEKKYANKRLLRATLERRAQSRFNAIKKQLSLLPPEQQSAFLTRQIETIHLQNSRLINDARYTSERVLQLLESNKK